MAARLYRYSGVRQATSRGAVGDGARQPDPRSTADNGADGSNVRWATVRNGPCKSTCFRDLRATVLNCCATGLVDPSGLRPQSVGPASATGQPPAGRPARSSSVRGRLPPRRSFPAGGTRRRHPPDLTSGTSPYRKACSGPRRISTGAITACCSTARDGQPAIDRGITPRPRLL